MKLFSIALLALITSAHAAELGSKCGLLDTNESDEWRSAGRSISLDADTSAEELAALPLLTKQQLIIAAKYFANESDSDVEIRNTFEAVQYMSGSDGINVQNYQVKRRRITEVMTYPGENPYSVIFKRGTKQVIAYGKDGTVYCK